MAGVMAHEPFAIDAVTHALGGADVASVEIVETFAATAAQVARLRVRFSDGRDPLTAIGKTASGAGLAAARRERTVFAQIAPLWASPAPRLLGSWDRGGADAQLLLVIEDLNLAGYAVLRDAASPAQLDGVVDTLVDLHARFWDDLQDEILDPGHPAASVTRAAQAWPPAVITAHAAATRDAAAQFLAARGDELSAAEHSLLAEVLAAWAPRFLARASGGRALTLIHADFHLLGNVFFAAGDPRPRVIDWSELKPGLGPHDLAYCLISAPSDDRAARDLALLRRYWEGLRAAGVNDYRWALCLWDYRFSLVTNLFQSVFQGSPTWFRRTAALVTELDCLAALRDPPPMSAG